MGTPADNAPLKKEAQAIVDDAKALPTNGKIDGTKLYTDLVALYKADGGKEGDVNGIPNNKAYIADMTAVNKQLSDAKILPGVSLYGAAQDVVAFVSKDGVMTAPVTDLSQRTLVPGQKPAPEKPAPEKPAPEKPAPEKQTGAPAAAGDPQEFGQNHRQYTQNADGTGFDYKLRQQEKGNDSIWWAAKDYLRSAKPGSEPSDVDVAAKVKKIFDANQDKFGTDYGDFLKNGSKKMKIGETFTIPIDKDGGEAPPGGKPAAPEAKALHSDQVDDSKTKKDDKTGITTKFDAKGNAVEVNYDDKNTSVVHRAADETVDGMADYAGNKYTRKDDGSWDAKDSTGKDIPAPATGPIKSIDMKPDGSIAISRNDKATDTIQLNGNTVKTDAKGNPTEVDYPAGGQTVVQRGDDGKVTGLTDAHGNAYTKKDGKWTATHTGDDKAVTPIADPPGSGPISDIDMDQNGVVTIKRAGKAQDVIAANGTMSTQPDFDGDPKTQADKSVVKSKAFNGTNQVVEVDYPNNTSATLQRKADGSVDSFTDSSGVKYTLDPTSKTWLVNGSPDKNTQGPVTKIEATPDGVVTLTRSKNAKDVYATDGTIKASDQDGKPLSLVTANQTEVDFDAKTGRPTQVVSSDWKLGSQVAYTDDTGTTIKSITSVSDPGTDKAASTEVVTLAADGNYHMKTGTGEVVFKAPPKVDPATGDIIITTDDGKQTAIHSDGTANEITPAPPPKQ